MSDRRQPSPRTVGLATALATALVTVVTTALVTVVTLGGAARPVAAAPGPGAAVVPLPDGFQPEGVAVGTGDLATTGFFGSRADGDIYAADLRTGEGHILAQGPGTPSLGLKVDDRDRLFVAGGSGGDLRVLDARTGRTLRSYQLVSGQDAFINDLVLTPGAVWVTDSSSAQLFKLPLGRRGGLPDAPQRLALRGDWSQGEGVSANGITTTPDGRFLLVVNSASGQLYRVPRATGRAAVVPLRGLGEPGLVNGDGLLREGSTLYAVQNQLDRVAVLRLTNDGSSARVTRILTDERFDVPTTVARSGRKLVLPNARFRTTPTPTTPYDAVRIADR